MPSYVIAGASLAGAKAAETLRDEGFDGDIVLIGSELERPYERPPLSKGYLLGNDQRDSFYVHAVGWYVEHAVDLREGVTVTAIDRGTGTVATSDGAQVPYDKLLLATGASPRRLNFPGSDREEVLYLRTIADSDRLRSAFQPGTRVVVAGAGWIGLETAAAARTAECAVTVLEPQPGALHDQLGPGARRRVRRPAPGARCGVPVRREGGRVPPRHGHHVRLAPKSPPTSWSSASARPRTTTWPPAAGLETGNGVLVDEALRTSDPDIFAAGDVANSFHPLLGRRVRVEHWANALNGGPAAARSMLGQSVSYDPVPYFYSDQYDLGMECAGLPSPGSYDQVLYRGDRDAMEFIAFWLSGGAVIAGMNVNVWDVNDDIQALIRSSRPVDPARLTNPDIPLTDL